VARTAIIIAIGMLTIGTTNHPSTFCNPIDLDYRFTSREPAHRTAADPVIVPFKGEYYLFVTGAVGYWRTRDFVDWTFVQPRGLPRPATAPAALAIGDTLYVMAINTDIYGSSDPAGGEWRRIAPAGKWGDPALFRDDDGRVFVYYGLSQNGTISGQELDPSDGFRTIGNPFECFRGAYARRGWERRGEENLGAAGEKDDSPWIEGAWMTKHRGRYYLQYAAPGTEFRSYADGVFTAPTPRGPFTYAPNSPISHKPTGFNAGAGHGATFVDAQGRYWRIVTTVIAIADRFERRLGIFPASFDADGVMRTDTVFGDYPQFLPGRRRSSEGSNVAGWMQLSAGKPASASSSLPDHTVALAFDEDIKTYWSAAPRGGGVPPLNPGGGGAPPLNPGGGGAPPLNKDAAEWLAVDLRRTCTVNAVQVNFAEHEVRPSAESPRHHRYVVEHSADARTWRSLVDRRGAVKDTPHAYIELQAPVRTRHVRLTIDTMAGGGAPAVRDLRLFGRCEGSVPGRAADVTVERDAADRRRASVRWQHAAGADGYVVRYGIDRKKLYSNYQVRGVASVKINSLNADVEYYFTVDSFNDVGVTQGRDIVPARTPR
jgi:xylan 1,4-beta-xylosidase